MEGIKHASYQDCLRRLCSLGEEKESTAAAEAIRLLLAFFSPLLVPRTSSPTQKSTFKVSHWLRCLSIHTFRPLVDLQPLLGHLRILQEIQWHPHQVALDLVELGTDLFRVGVGVVKVALLELGVFGEELFVVFEGFDCEKRGGQFMGCRVAAVEEEGEEELWGVREEKAYCCYPDPL